MDRDILRSLAGRVAGIAALPIQEEKAALYRALNGLRPIRPVVLIDELPWNQLNGDGELTLGCQDPFFRGVEQRLRRLLWQWKHCPADMLVEPFYRLGRTVRSCPIGPEVRERTIGADEGNHIVSHQYEDQFPDFASLSQLRTPQLEIDWEDSRRNFERLSEAFGDALPVRFSGSSMEGFSPWDTLSTWRGVEPILTDLVDRPELLHEFLRRYLDIRLSILRQKEELGLLEAGEPTLHCTAGLVDELPGPVEGEHQTRKNIWGRGAAQIFAVVSPRMHDLFEIEYARRFFEGFGLVYYGCCEPLHDKIRIAEKLPNLRKLSITPWADVRRAVEQMGPRYICARKPNPAAVASGPVDTDLLRRDIRETLEVCRQNGTPVEFTLKDISGVGYRPENLTVWADTVMDCVGGR